MATVDAGIASLESGASLARGADGAAAKPSGIDLPGADATPAPPNTPPALAPQRAEDHVTQRWLMLMGGASLLALAIPTAWVTLSASRPGQLQSATLAWWWIAFAIFTLSWWAHARRSRGRRTTLLLIGIQSAAALAANWLIPTVFAGVAIGGLLLMMAAAMLATLPAGVALVWIGAQSLALLVIYLASHWGPQVALSAAGAYTAGQLAMLGIGRMAERQRLLREALAETVAELLSTRALLEESARSSERARIARELHDLLGHHLVAMRLQLEAAALEAQAIPEAKRRIAEAAGLARLLLADVRAAVSDMREGASIDLVAALRILATSAPGPRIELVVDPDFDAGGPARAATFLRCAQEAVTNARRHAGARCIRIDLRGETLTVADDGCGMGSARPGGGLRGMSERVSSLGGSLSVRTGPEGGTLVEAHVPRRLDAPQPLRAFLADDATPEKDASPR